MRFVYGLVLAGGLTLAASSPAHAQVGITVGNRYYGVGPGGVYTGTPYYGYNYGTGYNYGMPPGVTTYSSGYSGYVTRGYSYSPYTTSSYYGRTTYPYNYGYSQPAYGFGRRSVGFPVYGRRWGRFR
ncbi:MAG: hypothetical protein U0835_17835 [Isosphaeraceae bacterium]